MKLGLVTDCLADRSLEEAAAVCRRLGLEQVELGCGNWSPAPHVDLEKLTADAGARHRLLDTLIMAQETAEPNRVQCVMDYIAAHYMEPLTVQSLAQHFHYSRAWFSTWFQSAAGVSPYAYLLRCRLEAARQQLLHTDASVLEGVDDGHDRAEHHDGAAAEHALRQRGEEREHFCRSVRTHGHPPRFTEVGGEKPHQDIRHIQQKELFDVKLLFHLHRSSSFRLFRSTTAFLISALKWLSLASTDGRSLRSAFLTFF